MASPPISTNSPQYQAEVQILLNGPAGEPPPGTLPNFSNPPNLDAVYIATTAICGSVSFLAVLIRMYTKLFLIRSLVLEDCKSDSVSFRRFHLIRSVRYHRDSIRKAPFR